MARTQFGGRVTDGDPIVTKVIIGICVAVWIGQLVWPRVTAEMQFVPVLGDTEPWRFLTAAFVHAPSVQDFWHIGFNMYALWIIGQYLEPLLGRTRYVAIYLISAVGGSVGYELLASTPNSIADYARTGWFTPTVGASGAIFGLFLVLFILNRHLGRATGGILVLLVINAVIGYTIPSVAWQAHLGGAVTGALCALVVTAAASPGRRVWQWAGLTGVLALVVVLAMVRYATVQLPFVVVH
jgi:membrane associated rhomboid family serine protease